MQTKSGKSVHPIGIGTWNISSFINTEHTDSKYKGIEPVYGNEESEIEGVKYSISKGQNHIDCAELYGGFYTDEVIGRVVESERREDLYIADKLWKTSLGDGLVRPTVEKMLQKLKTDYIDLLYIHWPFDNPVPWQEAVPQIDKLIDEGIVRHFGLSNFTTEQMQEAIQLTKHSITANQMHYNVLNKQEINQEFIDFCKQHTIAIVPYQPIERQEVLNNETIQKIAAAHDATATEIALAWLLGQGMLPIPKAIQKAHIDENIKAVDIQLSPEEIEQLNKL